MPVQVEPGSIFSGRYVIHDQIGEGGMATVYRALDQELGTPVAVKVLKRELAQAVGADRFAREVDIASTMEHPNVVSLIDAGTSGEWLYCVMPLFEGETLRDRLDREGQLPVEDALTIAEAVAEGLDYAHDRGIVHRDVKPENILLSGDNVGLADFGIARAVVQAEEGNRLTSTGIVVGTPTYMSPEQAAADKVDGRADIYALGCVLYEMLSGGEPFTAPTAQGLLARHVHDPVPDVRTVRPGVPDPVWFAIQKAMAKAPADRFKSAGEFMAATRKASAPPTATLKRWWGRLGIIVLLAGVAATLLLRSTDSVPLDRGLVAVLPFSLTAPDETNPWLAEAMAIQISHLLDGTGGLTAVPEARTEVALEAAGKGWRDQLSASEARNVARELGAGLYLTGNVTSDGTESIVTARLTDTDTGEELNRLRQPVGELGVGSAIDRVLAALLIDVAGQTRQSATLFSQSQQALKAFVDGWVARREQRRVDAVQHFLRAVQLDTTFALAALAWEEASQWLPDGSEHRRAEIAEYVSRVREANVFRLPRVDQELHALMTMPFDSRQAQLERLEEASRLAPDRSSVWWRLGDHVFHEGPMMNVPDFRERATTAFERALAIGAFTPEIRLHLDEIRFDAGDSAFLRRYLKAPDSRGSFEGHYRDDTRAAALHWAAAWMLGDSAVIERYDRVLDSLPGAALQQILRYSNRLVVGFPQADHAAEVLAARGEVPGIVRAQVYGDLAAYQVNRGRPQLVERIYEEEYGAADHPRVYERVQRHFFPGIGEWSRLIDSSQTLERLLVDCSEAGDCLVRLGTAVRVNCGLGIGYARHSLVQDAQRHLNHLRSMKDHGPIAQTRRYAEICGLLVASALADGATAQPLLDEAAQLLDPSPLSRVDVMSLSLTLASLFEASDQPQRALEFATRQPYFVIESFYLTPALLMEGRLSLQMGDTTRAILAFQKVVALLSDPEPSVEPIAREARETLAELLAR